MTEMETLLVVIIGKLRAAFREVDVMTLLEVSLAGRQGDITITIFRLAKALDKRMEDVAAMVAQSCVHPVILKAESAGGFVNLYLDPRFLKMCFSSLVGHLCNTSASLVKTAATKIIMVEYLSPNTNKPLHLGHVRNGVTGKALSHLVESMGHKLIKAEMINDRGIHICKSMLAWRLWGNGETPEEAGMKGDHFVGKWYVEFSKQLAKNPGLEQRAQEVLRLWEGGDKETIRDWKLMNTWFMSGFRQTCQTYGFDFDAEFYESDTYKTGKLQIEEGLKRGVFRYDDQGRVVIDLPAKEFGLNEDQSSKVLTLLRKDGTGVYITQDLGTAKIKFSEYHVDSSWHVVAAEQNYYFKCLFFVLSKLGFAFREAMKHCSYGMVYLPDGRMKSREGTVVDADDLLGEVETAVLELRKEGKETSDLEVSAEDTRNIALAAIKFYLLRVNPDTDIYFNPKESVRLDGFTGPYCQYSYARVQSLLRKVKFEPQNRGPKQADFKEFWIDDNFRQLALMGLKFPEIVKSSFEALNPSIVCKYVFDFCQKVNQLYETHPVIIEQDEQKRAEMISMFANSAEIIQSALKILDIKTVDKM